MIAIALKGRQRQVAHSYSHAEYFDRTRITRITRILHNSSSSTFGLFVKSVFNFYHANIGVEHELHGCALKGQYIIAQGKRSGTL